MNLQLIDHAVVREYHQVRMCRRNEEMLDEVAILRCGAETAFATTALSRVSGDRRALDVTTVRDGDRNVLIRDQVFD